MDLPLHQSEPEHPVMPGSPAGPASTPTPPAPPGPPPFSGSDFGVQTLRRASGTTASLTPFSIAALALTLVAGGILLFQLSSVAAKEEQMSQALEEKKLAYQSLSKVAVRVDGINQLVLGLKQAYDAQLPFRGVIDLVEKTSLAAAKFSGVTIDQTGEVNISGVVPSYNDFARVVKALRDDQADSEEGITETVTINSAVQSMVAEGEGENAPRVRQTSFDITFKVKSELFNDPGSFAGYIEP